MNIDIEIIQFYRHLCIHPYIWIMWCESSILYTKTFRSSKHAGVGPDNFGNGCSTYGALQSLSLQLQATGHAHAHVPTAVDHWVNGCLRTDYTIARVCHPSIGTKVMLQVSTPATCTCRKNSGCVHAGSLKLLTDLLRPLMYPSKWMASSIHMGLPATAAGTGPPLAAPLARGGVQNAASAAATSCLMALWMSSCKSKLTLIICFNSCSCPLISCTSSRSSVKELAEGSSGSRRLQESWLIATLTIISFDYNPSVHGMQFGQGPIRSFCTTLPNLDIKIWRNLLPGIKNGNMTYCIY